MARRGTPRIPARSGAPRPYRNARARDALQRLVDTPTREGVDELLAACLAENLVVDVTGSPQGAEPRIRIITSTDGRPVLPLFTSTDELRLAVPREQHPRVQMLVLPGRDAFALIRTADFVAAQLDAGSIGQVITRSFLEHALDTEEP